MKFRLWLLSGLLLAPATHADWGRLFYTPAERAELERGVQPGTQTSAPPPLRRYDGEVRRSDGRTLHWVDGLPAAAPPNTVKPGESWQPVSGQVFPAGREPQP